MKNKLSDSWRTPDWLFDKLNKEHGPFNIDLCATAYNSRCEFFYENYLSGKVHEDFYSYDLTGFKTAFMNPPYSNPYPFIEKAWEDSKHCKIVLLVKVDTSTKWCKVFWDYNVKCPHCDEGTYELRISAPFEEPRWWTEECYKCNGTGVYNGPKPGASVYFLEKRVKFDPPVELVESGEVFKNGKGKWVQKCKICEGAGKYHVQSKKDKLGGRDFNCAQCSGKGYKPLSGPSFPSCVLVFDRRST